MTPPELLSQDEIDALLMGDSSADDFKAEGEASQAMRPYDPATQRRAIKERLLALDIINERFARHFRASVFTLLRRSSDITVSSSKYQRYSEFSRHLPMPANLNLISMKSGPNASHKHLRGTGMVAFPPDLVYMVVDNLFGGDGKMMMKAEGREFTATEQRIIMRLVGYAIDCYKSAWNSVLPLDIEYMRSEMQAKFANLTNSPNDLVINTTFTLEVGSLTTQFNIVLPYLMIEPVKALLISPPSEINQEEEHQWNSRISAELKDTVVELRTDFVDIDTTISAFMALNVGDVLQIDLPDFVTARVDEVPVMTCKYGQSAEGCLALSVEEVIDHKIQMPIPHDFVIGVSSKHI